MSLVTKKKGFGRTLPKRTVLRLVTTTDTNANSDMRFAIFLFNGTTILMLIILSPQHQARELFRGGCGTSLSHL